MQNVEGASNCNRNHSNAKIGELANKSANSRNLEAVAASEWPLVDVADVDEVDGVDTAPRVRTATAALVRPLTANGRLSLCERAQARSRGPT